MPEFTDPRTGLPVGEVPGSVPDSTGAGEPEGPTPQDVANAIGAKADAEQAANVAGLAAAGRRQDADIARRTVK